MAYNEKKKEYDLQYAKSKLKRVPLDFQKGKYEQIQAAAAKAEETVSGYIKKAIDMRMESESDEKN